MPLSPSSMASIPHLYPNYTFTTHDLSEFPTPHITSNASLIENTIWAAQDTFIPVLDINNGALDHIVSLDSDTMPCANWMPSFSDQVGGLSDLAISDCKMGFYGGFQNFNARYQPHIGDFGEECCAFLEDVKPPPYPNAARENWVYFCSSISPIVSFVKSLSLIIFFYSFFVSYVNVFTACLRK